MKPFKGIISALLIASAVTAMGQRVDRLGLTDISINRLNDSTLSVGMTVDPKLCHLKSSQLMEVVPVVVSEDGENSAELTPYSIAGKNQYYFNIRSGNDKAVYRSGSNTVTRYNETLRWQPWMAASTVGFFIRTSRCCGTPDTEEDMPIATIKANPPVIPVKEDIEIFVPTDTEGKEYNVEGKAYVNFPVNRTEIYPDYLNNPVELRKITNSIDTVRDNPDATIRHITLTGYASPEGPYLNNVRLADGRTKAVRDYVSRQYNFLDTVYKTASVPEDWVGLREAIVKSELPMKDQMISFIDSDYPIEKRNDRFRELFPANYNWLLKNVYPWLRHTDYLINYTIRKYTDLEEIREVYRVRPKNLSLDEIYKLAMSYPENSDEYFEIFENAAKLHSTNPLANINAANVALNRGDIDTAEKYLFRAGEGPEALYALGMLYAKKKEYDKALGYLLRSTDPRAAGAVRRIHEIQTFKSRIDFIPAATQEATE